jgi:hypothetical protein
MPEETKQPTAESSAAGSGQSSNFLDKAKNFFTMGGDKKKWTKAGILAIIILFLILICVTPVGAMALYFFQHSIGEPNGGCNSGVAGAGGGIPATVSTALHTNITTTTFGGCSNGKCADNKDSCNGSGGISTGCTAPSQYYAALPYSAIPLQCHGNINKCAHIIVTNPKNNQTVTLAVVDTGPWNTQDAPYILNGARPEAETGIDNTGRKTNKAGLDISPTAMKSLSGDDGSKFNWQFTTAPVVASTNGDCAGNSVFSPVDTSSLSSWYYNQGGTNHTGGGSWGNKVHQCSGWSDDHTYAQAGCGITSMAMIARYYGTNIDPYQMGGEFCSLTGSLGVGSKSSGADSVYTVAQKIMGMSAHKILNPSLDQIISTVKQYGPTLTEGDPCFGSSHGHFVVIAGYDGSNFILNDPSSSSRGLSGRKVPAANRGNIQAIWYFTK